MSQSTTQNRRWVLASRPHGAPVADNFRLEEQPIPAPAEGQVLLRTVWLSLDPYMRGRMSDAPSYSPPVEIGAVMVGGTVSRVETSRHPDYKEGEWVLGYSGWQEYELSDGQGRARDAGLHRVYGAARYRPASGRGNPCRGGGHGAGRRNGGADR